MRNKRLLFVLVGAVAFGLFAAVGWTRYLSNEQATSRTMQSVVVAKVDIPLGTKVAAEQLMTAQFPTGATPDGVFDKTDKIVGRVTVTNVAAREPVTDFKLAPEGSAGGLPPATPQSHRATTGKVYAGICGAGFLHPGPTVGVPTVIDPPAQSMKRNPLSKI